MGRDAGALAAGGRLMLALVVGVSLGDAVPVWAGGAALVVCVWLDAVAGWWLRRRGTGRTRAREGAELLADFGCFGGLPGAWVMSLAGEVWAVRGAVIVFLAAAAWRLARFHGRVWWRGGIADCPRLTAATQCRAWRG